jgi:hypothetical protein
MLILVHLVTAVFELIAVMLHSTVVQLLPLSFIDLQKKCVLFLPS